jgi:hypothetical protein
MYPQNFCVFQFCDVTKVVIKLSCFIVWKQRVCVSIVQSGLVLVYLELDANLMILGLDLMPHNMQKLSNLEFYFEAQIFKPILEIWFSVAHLRYLDWFSE